MDHELIRQYIKEYTIEALDASNRQVGQAADYLLTKKKPGLFTAHRKEKRAALSRVRKVFDASRSRSVWIVLKSLGLDELAKDEL